MLLYENTFPSNHDEFKTWYEVSYRDVVEMDAIWQACGAQLDQIQDGILTVINAMFIRYADERAVSLWEQFLWITGMHARSLDYRKLIILSYFIENGHIGEPEIRELLRLFTEAEYNIALDGGSIHLEIEDIGDLSYIDDFNNILLRKIPAHLGLGIVTKTTVEREIFIGGAVTQEIVTERLPDASESLDLEPMGELFFAGAVTREISIEYLVTSDLNE